MVYNQRRRPTIQSRVVTTMPSIGAATVVSSNQNTSFSTPAPVAAPYPTQQPVYNGAQFSSQDAPPPYDAATGKIPAEMQVCTYYVRCISTRMKLRTDYVLYIYEVNIIIVLFRESVHFLCIGVARTCLYYILSTLVVLPSCIYSLWHGLIPTSYF